MKRRPHSIVFLWMLIVLLTAGSASPTLASPFASTQVPQAQNNIKRVLVLNAYHEGFRWTDQIMQGIKSVFDEEEDVELFISHMDTKRCSHEDYFKQIRDLYAHKYRFLKFDAIVSSDDHALDFLLKYRDKLFPNLPVFFCGINNFKPSRIERHDGFTGVYETYDIVGTVDLMLQLHSDVKRIAIVIDASISGHYFRQRLERAELNFAGRVEFDYLNNLGWNELKTKLAALSEDTLVLWAIDLRIPEGISISSEKNVRMVSKASRFPTYCIWDVVDQGVVGGKITSPNYQEKAAAGMATKVLRGGRIQDMPVSGSPIVYLFDFRVMERFNISPSVLPQGSIVINQPFSVYEEYKQTVWLVLLFITFLITVIIALVYYIQNRKRAKEELRTSRDSLKLEIKRFENFFQMISDHVYIKDRDSQFVRINQGMAKMLNLREEREAIGKSDFDFFTEAHAQSAYDDEQEIMRTGIPKIGYEEMETWPNGRVTWCMSTKMPLRDPLGNVTGLIGVSYDITDRKREEEIQMALIRLIEYAADHTVQELLQDFLDEAEVLTISKVGFFHFVEEDQENLSLQTWSTNTLKNMCKVANLDRHYPISKAGVWVDCVRERKPVIHNDYANLAHKKGLPSGHASVIRELVVPVFREEKIVAILGVGNKDFDYDQQDVKTVQRLADLAWETIVRKRTENEREKLVKKLKFKNKELQDIVYTASHDLRSPLVNIQGFSGELQSDCIRFLELHAAQAAGEDKSEQIESLLKQDIPQSLGFITQSAHKMVSLLDGLLQVSRIGNVEIKSKSIDMNEKMSGVLASMEYLIKENDIAVTVDSLPNCIGDSNMLDQLFTNLLGNAVKYLDPTRKGQIQISGKVKNNMSVYCVADNGVGIDVRHQKKVFEIFHRLNPEGDIEGEGLGLTIVTRILDRLGGRIWLESEPGKGSRFFVSLPTGEV